MLRFICFEFMNLIGKQKNKMKNFGSYTNRLKHDQSSYAAKLSYTSDHKGLSQTLQCFDHRSMRSAHFDIFPSVKAEETCRRTKQDGLLPVGLVQISCLIHFTSSTARFRSDFFTQGRWFYHVPTMEMIVATALITAVGRVLSTRLKLLLI